MRSFAGRGVIVIDLPLGPRASRELPGLAAPDASRVTQVRTGPAAQAAPSPFPRRSYLPGASSRPVTWRGGDPRAGPQGRPV